jgi:hypothetical protein
MKVKANCTVKNSSVRDQYRNGIINKGAIITDPIPEFILDELKRGSSLFEIIEKDPVKAPPIEKAPPVAEAPVKAPPTEKEAPGLNRLVPSGISKNPLPPPPPPSAPKQGKKGASLRNKFK